MSSLREESDSASLADRLSASEETLRLIIESAPAGIAVVDREMRYIAWSKRWIKDYSLHGRHMLGVSHYELFPEIPERWKEIHRACMSGVSDFCEEDRFERADGSVQYLRWAIEPWRTAQGSVGGLIMFTEDITERRLIQEQLLQSQKLGSLGTLASGIAHDFNNILTVFLGALSALEKARTDAGVFEQTMQSLRATAERATGLTRQLLTFGQKTPSAAAMIDVRSLLQSILQIVSGTLPRSIRVTSDIESSLPPIIFDPGQFQQIITNLCINARDAMPAGGTLALRAVRISGSALSGRFASPFANEYVSVLVEDNGTGMDAETRRHAFEPFFTTKSPGQGTGLGLSIVHSLMLKQHGFIDIQSKPGEGTRISLFFPVPSDLPSA